MLSVQREEVPEVCAEGEAMSLFDRLSMLGISRAEAKAEIKALVREALAEIEAEKHCPPNITRDLGILFGGQRTQI